MLIKKQSILSGKFSTREIDITEKELESWVKSSRSIQDVFPLLSPDDREFLLSGSTPEEWDSAFEEDDDIYDEKSMINVHKVVDDVS